MTDADPPAITTVSDIPLGYEPIAEFEDHGDAVEHWREWVLKENTVLLVQEGRWWSLWVVKNHIWIS